MSPEARVRRFGGARMWLVVLVAGFGVATPARADVAAIKLREAVVNYCKYDFARLCPAQTDADGRDMAFCLKFSLSDLGLGCRHAVMDATRQPAAVQPAVP